MTEGGNSLQSAPLLRSRRAKCASTSWKIALADLMTVLFIFFLSLWVMLYVDSDDRTTILSALVEDDERGGQVDKSGVLSGASNPITGGSELAVRFESSLTSGAIYQSLGLSGGRRSQEQAFHVKKLDDGFLITGSGDLLFKKGRALFSDRKIRDDIHSLGAVLAERLDQIDRIEISGHTDSLPIKTLQFPSNWELSSARAGAVARIFEEEGVPRDRMMVIGMADTRPVESNVFRDGRKKNRRVEIRVFTKPTQPNSAERQD